MVYYEILKEEGNRIRLNLIYGMKGVFFLVILVRRKNIRYSENVFISLLWFFLW